MLTQASPKHLRRTRARVRQMLADEAQQGDAPEPRQRQRQHQHQLVPHQDAASRGEQDVTRPASTGAVHSPAVHRALHLQDQQALARRQRKEARELAQRKERRARESAARRVEHRRGQDSDTEGGSSGTDDRGGRRSVDADAARENAITLHKQLQDDLAAPPPSRLELRREERLRQSFAQATARGGSRSSRSSSSTSASPPVDMRDRESLSPPRTRGHSTRQPSVATTGSRRTGRHRRRHRDAKPHTALRRANSEPRPGRLSVSYANTPEEVLARLNKRGAARGGGIQGEIVEELGHRLATARGGAVTAAARPGARGVRGDARHTTATRSRSAAHQQQQQQQHHHHHDAQHVRRLFATPKRATTSRRNPSARTDPRLRAKIRQSMYDDSDASD